MKTVVLWHIHVDSLNMRDFRERHQSNSMRERKTSTKGSRTTSKGVSTATLNHKKNEFKMYNRYKFQS